MPRLLLTLIVSLVALVATFAVMVTADVDPDARRCGTAAILKNANASVRTSLPAETNTTSVSRMSSRSNTFQPIRIGTFFDSLYTPSMYCSSASGSVVEYDTVTIPCSESAILTDAKRDVLINKLAPAAVNLLEERLLVRRRAGPIKVPTYGPERYCGHFAIPDTHHKLGVSGYDVVFYVSAKPNAPGIAAWAIGCTDASDGDQRTLVAVINIGPDVLADATEIGVRTVVHEMIHGLGFDSYNFENRGLLSTQTVRDKSGATVLLANGVLQWVLEDQFDCPNREYMEMADNDGSHWKERTMREDVMGGFSQFGYISAITLGALEATGAYRGVYEKAEVSPWGNGAGCAFLDEPCLTNKVALPNTQFCTDTDNSYHCSPPRNAVAPCDGSIQQPIEHWAIGYGLWSPNLGVDYCPLYLAPGYGCEPSGNNFPDSVGGAGALCLDAARFQNSNLVTYGVCAQVRCNSGGSYDVKLKGDTAYRRCVPGQTLSMMSETGSVRNVTCPDVYEVCAMTREELGIYDNPRSSHSAPPLLRVTLTWVLCAALFVTWWM